MNGAAVFTLGLFFLIRPNPFVNSLDDSDVPVRGHEHISIVVKLTLRG